MKPPPLAYHRPATLDEALALLQDEATVALAGGQDLVPALNARRTRPAGVVDLGAIAELRGIAADGDQLRIGAMSRHAEIAGSVTVVDRSPLLSRAASCIGHRPIRNLGTLGGSLASALPGAELPTALMAADATIEIASATGRRTVPCADLFHAAGATDLGAGELITEVRMPPTAGDTGWAFLEHAGRGAFKFPLVSVAARLCAPEGAADLRVVVGGGADGPVDVTDLCRQNTAGPWTTPSAERLGTAVGFVDEVHAGRQHKLEVAATTIRRALSAIESKGGTR